MDEASASKVVRHDTWAGLRVGDEVEIKDRRARRGRFYFLAYVEHRSNGTRWVDVVGGRNGDRKLWSFLPDQVFASGESARGVSLEHAPRLPL
jgi:hypothetical protein